MKATFVAIVLAFVLFVGGMFYLYRDQFTAPASSEKTQPVPPQTATSSATNYDECIAEGNPPLPSDPDKCLTKDGHIFIKGVVE